MASRPIQNSHPGGIYVHIPFCVRKCPYCDFYSITDLDFIPRFLDALEREIRMVAPVDLKFDSLYLGGGTPSVLTPGQIKRILDLLSGHFTFLSDLEANIEVNPGTVDQAKLTEYRAIGLNRVTVGVQSFNDRNLGFLGRIHSSEQAAQTIEWARAAGFEHMGLDLIYGLPGQTAEDWFADMGRAVSLRPEHLSCYLLTVEKGTPLEKDVVCGRVPPMEDKLAAGLFRTTIEFLADSDYRQYEVSNFALDAGDGGIGNRSRHNQKYWTYAPYIGLGPGAHSFIEPERRWNFRNVDQYCKAASAGGSPVAGQESLSREQMMIESIYLGLRQADGIHLFSFQEKFGINLRDHLGGQLDDLLDEKLAFLQGDCIKLTTSGLLLLDSICAGLVQAVDD